MTLLFGSLSEREDIVPHSVLKDTVLTLTMHTLSLLADLGKNIIHDCDRRNQLCVASNVPGSDQSRRPFARISDNVTIEDFHHPL